jgi:hypothetical protein
MAKQQTPLTRGYRGALIGLRFSPNMERRDTLSNSWRDPKRVSSFTEASRKGASALSEVLDGIPAHHVGVQL